MYNSDITTFLTLRPVCPNTFIPTSEYITILEKTYTFCDAVIASGIRVDNHIIKRLQTFPKCVSKSKEWRCFKDMVVDVVDVREELEMIKTFGEGKIPIFGESISAINYIYSKSRSDEA